MTTSSVTLKSYTKARTHQQQEQSRGLGTSKASRLRPGQSEVPFARTSTQINNTQSSHIPKSVSIDDLIGAGKLITPIEHETVSLALESFDILNKVWHKHDAEDFKIEKESFGTGGFLGCIQSHQERKVVGGEEIQSRYMAYN